MAYADEMDFRPGPVLYSEYADGTRLPRLVVEVVRNGETIGAAELHLHRTKNSPHVSLGLTSRLKSD